MALPGCPQSICRPGRYNEGGRSRREPTACCRRFRDHPSPHGGAAPRARGGAGGRRRVEVGPASRPKCALVALRGRRKGGPSEPTRLRTRLGRALGLLISQCASCASRAPVPHADGGAAARRGPVVRSAPICGSIRGSDHRELARHEQTLRSKRRRSTFVACQNRVGPLDQYLCRGRALTSGKQHRNCTGEVDHAGPARKRFTASPEVARPYPTHRCRVPRTSKIPQGGRNPMYMPGCC